MPPRKNDNKCKTAFYPGCLKRRLKFGPKKIEMVGSEKPYRSLHSINFTFGS